MADSPYSHAPLDPQPPARPAADALPPVEPPSAKFLVQLFLIPGLIVAMIVGAWVLFIWVARTSSDPAQYLEALGRSGPARWQAAANLADVLRGNWHEEFKTNANAVQKISDLLSKEVDRPLSDRGTPEESVSMRVFLCRSLGEFYRPEGIGALLKAATIEREPADRDVRRAALEAIALLSANLQKQTPPRSFADPQTMPTLAKLANDPEPLIRSSTAFALGVIGAPEAIELLVPLLSDSSADVRFNAATGLARHGREEAIPVLASMLDKADVAIAVEKEQDVDMRPFKTISIEVNAMRAVQQLKKKNPQADVALIEEKIRTLQAGELSQEARLEADATLRHLAKDQAPAESKQPRADLPQARFF